MTDQPTLLPCPNPWCDGGPILENNGSGQWWVRCNCCWVKPGYSLNEAEAIAAWNMRPEQFAENANCSLQAHADAMAGALEEIADDWLTNCEHCVTARRARTAYLTWKERV